MPSLVGSEMCIRDSSLPVPPQSRRPELLARVQALTRQGSSVQLDQELSQLRSWIQEHPLDAQAWQVLAAGLMTQSRALQSLRAEGEAQWARLDYNGAIDRFKAAQNLARKQPLQGADQIEASIVDARLRMVQSLWREQLLER